MYLSENTSAVRYKYAGLIFCALGIASYAHLAKQTKDGDPVKVFFAITLVAGLRIFEWGEVIEDAEKERFAAYRAEQKKMAVALKAAEPAGE